MLEEGLADGMVTGVTRNYPESLKPALQVIGLQKNVKKVAGLYIALSNDGPIFSDTTINKSPEEQELIDIILLTAKEVRRFGIKPVIALLSYSNFGSVRNQETKKLRNVIDFFHKNHPNLLIDGEIQANFALNNEKRKEQFPHSKLKNENVNTLIFPNLDSGNISYKLLQELSSYETIGPILLGMKKPAYIVQLESSVKEIVNITKIVAAAAQLKEINYDNSFKGNITELNPTNIVIDCNGIGYYLNISLNTFSKIDKDKTSDHTILTYLHVREDAHTLYGFCDQEERKIFLMLLSSIWNRSFYSDDDTLSSLSSNEIRMAILKEDIVTLKSIKGIGMKSAQRIIIDLKDKMNDLKLSQTDLIVITII